jgi:hypothetical protein
MATKKLTPRQQDNMILSAQTAHLIAVVGDGDFPYDMLRYDLAWPATGGDSALIGYNNKTSVRRIELRSLKLPTIARWASFGWKVVAVNGERVA